MNQIVQSHFYQMITIYLTLNASMQFSELFFIRDFTILSVFLNNELL